jgi:hypothetical protein
LEYKIFSSILKNAQAYYNASKVVGLGPGVTNLNFSMGSTDEKLISLETARHLRIFFGTRASCSSPAKESKKNMFIWMKKQKNRQKMFISMKKQKNRQKNVHFDEKAKELIKKCSFR